jgi:hypothetical protein
MVNSNQDRKIFTFEGDKYNIENLKKEVLDLISSIAVADNKLKDAEATLRLYALARQTMTAKLKVELSGVEKIN